MGAAVAMKGIIKHYNQDKGFGFIKGDNGDVFFHVSKVLNQSVTPRTGLAVEYKQGTNEKGTFAYDVEITEDVKPIFIQFGNTRIKLSNIKTYSIVDHGPTIINGVKDLEKEIKYLEDHPGHTIYEGISKLDLDTMKERYTRELHSDAYQAALAGKAKILYIQTYQGDTYYVAEYHTAIAGSHVFDVYDCNIYEKLELLDKYLLG